ncbi:enoyl-CoA hydratase/isomerase family protein [Aliifodinibius sp. S!AR15-10]|uniref:enoyl-CoA hydratase/isomerase family protein n=1 Tax=Aliifodinibius sp. S!AR15-10 TaxID=2950437 RepID=UPI002866B959|nr:enoyl-CoA hydratase/isomerase family protein [Aliifodinibius sp. S!AR15-10]MDR8394164.1 enoyl-CoA hydratase/isomerase family protein [Aliifodinibius sp. S!AR15-10]
MSVLQANKDRHILTASIHRPGALNAINFKVMEQLEDLLDRLEKDNEIRTFILTSAGNEVFISGGDLKEFHGIKSAREAKLMARRMGSILKRIEKLPCWTIASINGSTYGGGWEIMLAFDFRIASQNATFNFSQAKFYLPPGWGGLTRLTEKVGRSTALRWLAEAAEVDADTALQHKLVDKVADPEVLGKETEQWAHNLSKNDRDFIQTLKRGALRYSKIRWEAIEKELEPFARFWEDERHEEQVKKFLGRNNK